MALSPNVELTSLEDLLLQQLQDLYAAEQHQAQALPKMVDAASAHQLKSALQDHFAETKQHVSRLETIFEMLEKPATGDPGEAMQGLLKEANCTVQAQGDAAVKDAALIAAAQRLEHFEMSAYGTARSLADQLGQHEIARVLQETLNEEGQANKSLTKVAESWVNVQAAHAHT